VVRQLLQAGSEADHIVLATYVVHGTARQGVMNGKQISYFGFRGLSGRVFQEIVTTFPRKTAVKPETCWSVSPSQ